MKIERLIAPYVVEKGEVDGQLVQVTIRAADGGVLGYTELEQATRQILGLFQPALARGSRQSHTVEANASNPGAQPIRAFDGAAGEALSELEAVYQAEHGKVTPNYLAQLAATYEALVPEGRGVSSAIADALDRPLPTVKGHIMRARREGFLTEAVQGREGGSATQKALRIIHQADVSGPPITAKVEQGGMRDFELGQLRSALSEHGPRDEKYLALLSWEYVRAVERGQDDIDAYLAEVVGELVDAVRAHLKRARDGKLLSGNQLSARGEKVVEPYAVAWMDELARLDKATRSAEFAVADA